MTDEKIIQLSTPYLSGNEKKYVNECLDTNWISSVGRFVGDFENAFVKYVGAKRAVAVSCGTAGLHLSLIVSGIKQDEEVFVPSLTFIAPVNAIRYTGAWPVFIDSNLTDMGISQEAIEKFIEQNCSFKNNILKNNKTGRRISALIGVHLFGHSCDTDRLSEIAEKYNLTFIEDAAEGIGCIYKGRHVGNAGKFGCFSFNGNKTLTTGGGGMVVTSDDVLADRIKHLSTQAKKDDFYYVHDETGYNYRMMNIQAAIGLAQLEHLEEMIGRKREIHSEYVKAFSDVKGLSVFTAPSDCRSGYWFAVLFLPEGRRDEFIKYMTEKRIQVRPLWTLNHTQPMYAGCPHGEMTNDDLMYRTGICIPCSAHMDDDDVKRVIITVRNFFKA